MNAFYQHPKDNIGMPYRCFDRLLLHGLIQPFQQPERVVGFFHSYRQLCPVSRDLLRQISSQYHPWVQQRSQQWKAPIVPAPEGRRDELVEPYFRQAQPDQMGVILKAREPARILTSVGKDNRWHLALKQRWVEPYNFYIQEARWGPRFVRVCPYFPFSARICLNQHHWLALRLPEHGIGFRQCGHAFLSCSDPETLQKLADSLTARDLIQWGQKWLAYLTPFFAEKERQQAGCQHRWFFSPVEYCDNLVFRRRAALDQLGERLLDANRTIGPPDKLALIFGRKITPRYPGPLQTVIEDLDLPNPVERSHYKHGFLKQYVRDHRLLRTEAATNDVTDYRVGKAVEHLPELGQKMQPITDRYQDVQPDILETFVDRGQLRQLSQPTVLANGKRIPGLKLDHPRPLAVRHALVRFAHIAASSTFATPQVYPHVREALGLAVSEYKLSSLRYDLWKRRAQGLVEKVPHSHRYRLPAMGYRLCLVYLKLFEKIYAPLTAGLLAPFGGDRALPPQRIAQLDRLYQRVVTALDQWLEAVGLKAA